MAIISSGDCSYGIYSYAYVTRGPLFVAGHWQSSDFSFTNKDYLNPKSM